MRSKKILAMTMLHLCATQVVQQSLLESPPCYPVKAEHPKPKHPKLKHMRKLK